MATRCSIGILLNIECSSGTDVKGIDSIPRATKIRILSHFEASTHLENVCLKHMNDLGMHTYERCANPEHKPPFKTTKALRKISLNDYVRVGSKFEFIKPGAYLCNRFKDCFQKFIGPSFEIPTVPLRSQVLASQPYFKSLNALIKDLDGTPVDFNTWTVTDFQTSIAMAFTFVVNKLHDSLKHAGYELDNVILTKEEHDIKQLTEKSARYDEMVSTLRCELENTRSSEKRLKLLAIVPKSIPFNEATEIFKMSKRTLSKARCLRDGQGTTLITPAPKKGNPLPLKTRTLVKEFILGFDISSPSPSLRDSISARVGPKGNIKKIKLQKHFMNCYMHTAHLKFLKRYPEHKISLPAFRRLRPLNCIPVTKNTFRNVCCCRKHEDVRLMFNALDVRLHKPILHKLACDSTDKNCTFRRCQNCINNAAIVEKDIRDILASGRFENKMSISFRQWESHPHTFLVTKTLPKDDFVALLLEKSAALLRHSHIVKSQNGTHRSTKESLSTNQKKALLVADFAQNYTTVVQDEVQSGFFCHQQITIHPFGLFYAEEQGGPVNFYSFCVISDELRHNTNTFFAFTKVLLDHIKIRFPLIEEIEQFTDGCAGQYKNFKAFINSYYAEQDHGIRFTLHFFGSGHGKNVCDAIAGTVKRMATDASLYCGAIINDSTAFFEWTATTGRDKIKFFHITQDRVAEIIDEFSLEARYESFSTIQYTQKIHCVRVSEDKYGLEFYELSSDEVALCKRVIHTPAAVQPIITENSINDHFAVLYEHRGFVAWYPAEVVEVDMDIGEAFVSFYIPQKGGHFIRESASCWVPFFDIKRELPLPRADCRRYYLDSEIVLGLDALYGKARTN